MVQLFDMGLVIQRISQRPMERTQGIGFDADVVDANQLAGSQTK